MNVTEVGCEDGSYMELIHDQVQWLRLALLVFVQQSYLTIIALRIVTGLRGRGCVYSYVLLLNVQSLDRA
jgi:hypothetical protein